MGQLGTDDTTFVNIFCLRSYNHLRAVFAAYQNQTGVTMETVIELEFSGAIRTLFLSLGIQQLMFIDTSIVHPY